MLGHLAALMAYVVLRHVPFGIDEGEPQRRERALALAALCIGGMVTPKCVDDPALAEDLRRAAHRQALHIGGWNGAHLKAAADDAAERTIVKSLCIISLSRSR
jgi:hypothetical protein